MHPVIPMSVKLEALPMWEAHGQGVPVFPISGGSIFRGKWRAAWHCSQGGGGGRKSPSSDQHIRILWHVKHGGAGMGGSPRGGSSNCKQTHNFPIVTDQKSFSPLDWDRPCTQFSPLNSNRCAHSEVPTGTSTQPSWQSSRPCSSVLSLILRPHHSCRHPTPSGAKPACVPYHFHSSALALPCQDIQLV